MSLNFTRYELLELFDDERIIDEENQDYEYTVYVGDNLYFKLHIFAYDEYASITLENKAYNLPIFNIGLDGIVDIKVECNTANQKFLNLYKYIKREENIYEDKELREPSFKIMIKPHVSFQCRIENN